MTLFVFFRTAYNSVTVNMGKKSGIYSVVQFVWQCCNYLLVESSRLQSVGFILSHGYIQMDDTFRPRSAEA